jgi:ribose transport system ATP-binding protein
MAAGVMLVPSDRTAEGLIEELSTRENLALVSWPRLAVAGCINQQAVNVLTTLLQEHVSLAQEVADTPVRDLSAGQQQKVSMAKWLARQPQVALFDEPGRGIDIASKAEVYELMERLAERGAAVLFHSSDWQEILRMADRVLVMNNGRLAGILTRDDDFTERGIMRLAADMTADGPDAALHAPPA